MKTIGKYATAMALMGMLALAAASPSEARNGRNAAAAIGFGVGAVVGAAIASLRPSCSKLRPALHSTRGSLLRRARGLRTPRRA